jgi:Cu2+-exporting ATPase
MGWDGRLRAFIIVSDVVRTEAAGAIGEIKKMNCAVEIMSGDNRVTTRSIASQVGVDTALSEVSPTGKKEHIAELQKKKEKVMMVGDGINDAPALTQASVGVALGRGTDIAMESADAVLIRNDLRLIPYFIGLSRKTFSIIRQNIFWAFFYNIVAVPLAVAGLLHPIVAAGAMAMSSLFVVGNALRIRG